MTLSADYNAADVQRELDVLKSRINIAEQYVQFQPLAAAPLNPLEGWVAVSDGTGSGFDSVSGAGLYRFIGSAWVPADDTVSPVFTGDPKAPTPSAGDDDTSIATTAFVQTELTDVTFTARVNFNGTGTVAIRAELNVASITDNGTGDYTVNFSTALSNNTYTPLTSVENTSGAGRVAGASSLSTSSFRIIVRIFAGTAVDSSIIFAGVVGG